MEKLLLENLTTLSLMLLCLSISAFFSGSETAFFSLSTYDKKQLQKSTKTLHRLLCQLLEQSQKLLITILFGNMIVNILFFTLTVSLQRHIYPLYGEWGVGAIGITSVFVLVVFGEVTPKAISLTIPKTIASITCLPLFLLIKILAFPVKILENINKIFIKITIKNLTIKPKQEELKHLLELVKNKKILNENEIALLKEILDLDTIQAREIMIPRVRINCIDLKKHNPEQIRKKIAQKRHRYYPVYEDQLDNILGVLSSKEFLLLQPKNIKPLLIQIPFVTEYSPLSYVLYLLKNHPAAMAAVVDEYGGLAGLITLKDIVQEIVGNLKSEFHQQPSEIVQISPNEYHILGELPLRELTEITKIPIENTKITTTAGLIASLLDNVPQEGDEITYKNLYFKVLQTQRRSASKILLKILPQPTQPPKDIK